MSYALAYERDVLGRIVRKDEDILGEGVTTYAYHYDVAGRLVQVDETGVPSALYTYDANGNRETCSDDWGTVTDPETTYDAQDRLVAYGPHIYTYTANGELTSRTTGADTTSYAYDVFGNLREVDRPGTFSDIRCVIDPTDRRIGKEVRPPDDADPQTVESYALVQGFLYADDLNPVAELDAQGQLRSRFVYATRANVPDFFMAYDGVDAGGAPVQVGTCAINADPLGSPRLVVDVATGEIRARIDYDAFGRVRVYEEWPSGTLPLQPFGFAGGLRDPDTGLVRFGARDYDPETGRWTAKDPIRFDGGDANLYVYVLMDPVNFMDSDGLERSPAANGPSGADKHRGSPTPTPPKNGPGAGPRPRCGQKNSDGPKSEERKWQPPSHPLYPPIPPVHGPKRLPRTPLRPLHPKYWRFGTQEQDATLALSLGRGSAQCVDLSAARGT